jgi:hypothetical protein
VTAVEDKIHPKWGVKYSALKERVEALPNNPEKIYREFGLTVTKITGVEVSGAGYNRSFAFKGGGYKRPELVAKAFYESLGYVVTWSEGFALQVIVESLLSEAAYRIKDRLALHRFYAEFDDVAIPDENDEDIDWDLPQIMAKLAREERELISKIREDVTPLCSVLYEPLRSLLYEDDELLLSRFAIPEESNGLIFFDEDVKFLRNIFKQSLICVANDMPVDSLARWFPDVSSMSADHYQRKRNLNEWTLLFVKETLSKIKWLPIAEAVIQGRGYFSNSSDLTLFSTDGSVRFVEVKYQDKLTRSQLDVFSMSLYRDYDLELAIIVDR